MNLANTNNSKKEKPWFMNENRENNDPFTNVLFANNNEIIFFILVTMTV